MTTLDGFDIPDWAVRAYVPASVRIVSMALALAIVVVIVVAATQ